MRGFDFRLDPRAVRLSAEEIRADLEYPVSVAASRNGRVRYVRQADGRQAAGRHDGR
jgi:hypothetical protein